MSGVNKVILLGRLGKDPELKDVNGLQIANFSIATSKSWKDDSGEKKEKTTWHDVVCFKKTAELAGKYLKKGSQIYIEGELENRSWDDKETGKKRYKTEIIAQNIQFCSDNAQSAEKNNPTPEAKSSAPAVDKNDEIPF